MNSIRWTNLPLVIDHGRLCNVATGLVGEEIPKGKWTHVAAVCNGRCTLLYINGREVAQVKILPLSFYPEQSESMNHQRALLVVALMKCAFGKQD